MIARLVILWAIAVLCSCSLNRKTQSPTATVTTPTGTVLTQTGDAATPASVSTKTATQTIVVPAQSVVWQNDQTGQLQYRLAKDSVMTAVTKTEEAKAPQAFTPPAPPTPGEEADAKAKFWYRIGVAVGGVAGVFGLVRGWDWVMYGGGSVAAGCLFGLFVQSHPVLLIVIGLGAAVAIAGPVIWHTKLKNLPLKS